MQRRFLPFLWAFTLLMLFAQAGVAGAASYVVAPFQVNGSSGYSYLEKAIPPMLSARLFWEGRFEPVPGQDALVQSASALKTSDDAARLRAAQKADYVVWGTVTVMGEQAGLDVSVMDAQGKVWQKAGQAPLNNLIGGVQLAADAINIEVFGRPAQNVRAGSPAVVAPMNPGFVVNETQAGTVYLNPQFRYQGVDNDRLRSQRLDIESLGMEVADVNGDGKNEVLLFDENAVYAYRMDGTRLEKIAEHRLPSSVKPLLLRSIRSGGQSFILVSCQDKTTSEAHSIVLSLAGNQFSVTESRLSFYVNVVKLPPLFEPAVIGQYGDRTRVVRGSVFEAVRQGGSFVKGANLANMPKEANVFNFAWVPGNERSGGDYLVALNESENLLTFDPAGRRVAKSDDRFSGGSIGINIDISMPGMNATRDEIPKMYYVPMRMIPTDLDKNGTYELLLNKPVSTASQLFNNYRTFPQGEIQSLIWDGIGMDLVWKTRRIKGTVVDLAVADADNDGVLDLVVNVNTYPGTFGAGKIRSLVTLYPLDLSQTDPGTRVAPEF